HDRALAEQQSAARAAAFRHDSLAGPAVPGRGAVPARDGAGRRSARAGAGQRGRRSDETRGGAGAGAGLRAGDGQAAGSADRRPDDHGAFCRRPRDGAAGVPPAAGAAGPGGGGGHSGGAHALSIHGDDQRLRGRGRGRVDHGADWDGAVREEDAVSEPAPANKGFIDKVFNFLGIEQEQAAAGDAQPAEAPLSREPASEPRRGRLVSLPGSRRSDGQLLSVVVQRPTSFNDVQMVADCLKERRPVILSVELVPKEIARRLVDFVSGAAYALDGRMVRLSEALFLFTPSNVVIEVPEAAALEGYDDFEVER